MNTPTIQYKGEPCEIVLSNSAFMRFTRRGGQLDKLQSDPVEQGITLLCAVLDLPGDPIEHADDFPPIAQMVEPLTKAVEVYQGGVPGEPIGGSSERSPESDTD